MSKIIVDAAEYLTPGAETFWKWTADHQAIEWLTGETIVFRSELDTLIAPFVDEGLPPFEIVLLTLAACRNRSAPVVRELPTLLPFVKSQLEFSLRQHVRAVAEQLELVAHLPAELRSSLDGKHAVMALVFENGPHRQSRDFSRGCLDWIRQGLCVDETVLPKPKPRATWIFELRCLHDGLLAVNETAVRLRMKTGFDALPQPSLVPLELPLIPQPLEPARLSIQQLLKELQQDEQHAGIAQLARHLFSLMTLPRPLSTPDDQPVGGVADITNRGPFDRLLLSELAHDNDVLTTRVALNEAMYYRREIPPAFPVRERLILVDAGIRMWGLPRLYAVAAMLALVNQQPAGAEARVFCAGTNVLRTIDLSTRETLIEHLGRLEVAAHPGAVLPEFFAAANDQLAEFVIIISEDVLRDPEFRQALTEFRAANLYLVTLTREGDLRLLQRSRQGERILRQARLDLDQILQTSPQTPHNLLDTTIDPRLPAIFLTHPFPLLIPHQIHWDSCGVIQTLSESRYKEELFAVSHDQRLTLWSSSQMGPRQLSQQLPPGKLLWHESVWEQGAFQLRFVIGTLQQGRLFLVTVIGKDTQSIPLPGGERPVRGITEQGGVLYVAVSGHMVLCSLATGYSTTVEVPKHLKWIQGRFFEDDEYYVALSENRQSVTWHRLHKKRSRHERPKAIFDCRPLNSPVIVQSDNSVLLPGSNRQLQFSTTYPGINATPVSETCIGERLDTSKTLRVARISADGGRLVLEPQPQQPILHNSWLVDFHNLTSTPGFGHADRLLNTTSIKFPIQKSLRTRFASIGTYQGELVLLSYKGDRVSFSLRKAPTRIELTSLPVPHSLIEHLSKFELIESPGSVFTLRQTTWPDGSRACLDSRGLLHLQSSDPRIPELSIVLSDGPNSGWCSYNQVWGDKIYTGEVAPDLRVDPEIVYCDWLTCFTRRLR